MLGLTRFTAAKALSGTSVVNSGPSADGKTFTGKAPAGATVYVLKNNTQVGTAIADASGIWSYTLSAIPNLGDLIKVQATVESNIFAVLTGSPQYPLFSGVNLAGPDFGFESSASVPGNLNTNYFYADNAEVNFFASRGLNTFRLPHLWERVQKTLGGALDTAEMVEIDRIIDLSTSLGQYVVLEPHNYARRYVSGTKQIIGQSGGLVTDAHFVDYWTKLATKYKANPRVIFGLMNEPYSVDLPTWLVTVNAVIAAIRATGATNLILVPGSAYTGAWSWVSSGNSAVMGGVVDPTGNFAFEMHQYLDSDRSGTSTTCIANRGATELAAATAWCRSNGFRAFLGEFSAGRNATCYNELESLLGYMDANRDVWIGSTYWLGGAGTDPANNEFSVEPLLSPNQGIAGSQLSFLTAHAAPANNWIARRSSFDLDFVNQKYFGAELAELIAKSNGALRFGPGGLLIDSTVKDNIKLIGPLLQFLKRSAGTLVVETSTATFGAPNTSIIGSTGGRNELFLGGVDQLAAYDGTSTIYSGNAARPFASTINRSVFSWSGANQYICMTGGGIGTAARAHPAPADVWLGSLDGTQRFLNGGIRRITAYRDPVTVTADLQALVA